MDCCARGPSAPAPGEQVEDGPVAPRPAPSGMLKVVRVGTARVRHPYSCRVHDAESVHGSEACDSAGATWTVEPPLCSSE